MPPSTSEAKHSVLGIVLLFGLVLAAGCGLSWANLDARAGRHDLFMDETIFFDNVTAIYRAAGVRNTTEALLVGPDQRYGQIGFLICAATGAIPYQAGDESALVLAIRSTCLVCLLTSYLLFGLCLLRLAPQRPWLALGTVTMCLVLPGTVYYGTMPKPEPFQLLAIALFAWTALGRGNCTGWPALFLGMAFGAKISTLPLLVVWAPLVWWDCRNSPCRLGDLVRTGSWMTAGAVLAEPAILLNIKSYLASTFLNTTHGADRAEIGVGAWMRFIGDGLLGYSGAALAGFVAALTGLVIWQGSTSIRRHGTAILEQPGAAQAFLFFAGGGLTLTLVLFQVHRLWHFYLHPGLVLLIFGGAFALTWENAINRWIRVGLILAILGFISQGLTDQHRKVTKLAHRSQGADYQLQDRTYRQVLELIHRFIDGSGERLGVIIDPYLWDPGELPWMHRVCAWGPRYPWAYPGSVAFIGPKLNPLTAPVPPMRSDLDDIATARADLERALAGPNPNWAIWSRGDASMPLLVLVRPQVLRAVPPP